MPASLPDNPLYCFAPMNDADDEPPQIRILVEGPAYAFCPSGGSHDGPFQIRIAVEGMAVSIPALPRAQEP